MSGFPFSDPFFWPGFPSYSIYIYTHISLSLHRIISLSFSMVRFSLIFHPSFVLCLSFPTAVLTVLSEFLDAAKVLWLSAGVVVIFGLRVPGLVCCLFFLVFAGLLLCPCIPGKTVCLHGLSGYWGSVG